MTRRLLALGLATAMLALSGMSARAGNIPLPTTLDQLLIPGNSATPDNNLVFSDFSYTRSPSTAPPAPGDVHVLPFATNGETGLTFTGNFSASPNSSVDYAIVYNVTATTGLISGAFLSATGTTSGDGSWFVSEHILGTSLRWDVSSTGVPETTVSLPAVPAGTPIRIEKDIVVFGGTTGASVSIINQGFSVVPEPTSMALLGIGLTGLFTFRRFFKRAFVA